jgi:hypothetical protein
MSPSYYPTGYPTVYPVGYPVGYPSGYPISGYPGIGSNQDGGSRPARMNRDRAYQYTNITGSGVLRGPLPIITDFGGAGGIGGQNYAGGGGTYGGLGFGFGPGAGIYSGRNGIGGLQPPGVSVNQAYNTLVGLPAYQGMLGGGFGLGFGGGFPGMGFPPYGYPGLGFPGAFPGMYPPLGFPGTFPGFPGPSGFPPKFGGFGNGGNGL